MGQFFPFFLSALNYQRTCIYINLRSLCRLASGGSDSKDHVGEWKLRLVELNLSVSVYLRLTYNEQCLLPVQGVLNYCTRYSFRHLRHLPKRLNERTWIRGRTIAYNNKKVFNQL